jgi:hypothetical protein
MLTINSVNIIELIQGVVPGAGYVRCDITIGESDSILFDIYFTASLRNYNFRKVAKTLKDALPNVYIDAHFEIISPDEDYPKVMRLD